MLLSRRHSAFTLLELLLTLGVISVLALVLMGTLHRGKQSMDQTRNINQLRQLGIACIQYANDHNRTFPIATSAGLTQATVSHSLASGDAPRKLIDKGNLGGIGQGTYDYVTNPDLFYSPHAMRMRRERPPQQFYLRPDTGYRIGYLAISLPRQNQVFPEIGPLVAGLFNERLDDPGNAPLYCDFAGGLDAEEELSFSECSFVLKDGSVRALRRVEIQSASWATIIRRMAGWDQ